MVDIPKDTVIKEKDSIYNSVFVIVSGKMAVYMFPQGKKELLTTLKSTDVVGEYTLNFIASKAAEYVALTDMHVIKFQKDEYERAMNDTKLEYLGRAHQFVLELFSDSFKGKPEDLKRLAKNLKFKTFQKEEFVALEGCVPD